MAAAPAQAHLARLESALAAVEDDHAPGAAVDHRRIGDGDHRVSGPGGDLHLGIHAGEQHAVRVRELDPDPGRPRRRVELGVEQLDAAREGAAGKADQSMQMAQVLIGLGYLLFIGYPAMIAVLNF